MIDSPNNLFNFNCSASRYLYDKLEMKLQDNADRGVLPV